MNKYFSVGYEPTGREWAAITFMTTALHLKTKLGRYPFVSEVSAELQVEKEQRDANYRWWFGDSKPVPMPAGGYSAQQLQEFSRQRVLRDGMRVKLGAFRANDIRFMHELPEAVLREHLTPEELELVGDHTIL
jgi:hypothetical protein